GSQAPRGSTAGAFDRTPDHHGPAESRQPLRPHDRHLPAVSRPSADFRRRIRPPPRSRFHASSRVLSGERIRLGPIEQRVLVYYCRTPVRELDLVVRPNFPTKTVLPGRFVTHVVGLDTGFGLSVAEEDGRFELVRGEPHGEKEVYMADKKRALILCTGNSARCQCKPPRWCEIHVIPVDVRVITARRVEHVPRHCNDDYGPSETARTGNLHSYLH